MLNLEMRAFLLVLAIEAFFVLVYVFNLDRVRQGMGFALASTSVYFALFFELLAVSPITVRLSRPRFRDRPK